MFFTSSRRPVAPAFASLVAAGACLSLAACVEPIDSASPEVASGDAGASIAPPVIADAGASAPADVVPSAAPDAGAHPSPMPTVRVENRVCPEGDVGESLCSIPVRLSEVADHDVIVFVDVDAAASTASEGVDYRVSHFGITIAAGQTQGEIPLWILGDRNVEADEVVAYRITSLRGAEVDIGRGFVSILTDDRAPVPLLPASNGDHALQSGRGFHTATALPDGRVLLVGGLVNGATTNSIEVVDVDGSTHAFGETLLAPRMRHTATLLADGRVLVVGGVSNASPLAYATTELVDAARGTVTPGPTLADGRLTHSAVALQDGSVLIAGGVISAAGGSCLASAERFVPRAGGAPDHVVPTENALPSPSDSMAAARAADGSVLFLGGACTDPLKVVRYVPGVGFRREASNLHSVRVAASATSLDDGRIFLAGGVNTVTGTLVAETEFVDARSAVSSVGPSLVEPRFAHRSATLDDGRVVLSGGSFFAGGLEPRATVEVFDPAMNTVRTAFTLRQPRAEHAIARLGNRVLHLGGYVIDGGGARSLANYEVTTF